MTSRVLVVDDIEMNARLLEARLMAEYFEVTCAANGPDAIEIVQAGECDIVLLDVMMPGMDGFEVCRRLKADPRTTHVPIVMVTALDERRDRITGLQAGADDFLTKPVDDVALVTRVKSLTRLKMLTDELRLRAITSREVNGLENALHGDLPNGSGGRVAVIDDNPTSYERTLKALAGDQTVEVLSRPDEAVFRAAEGNYDLIVLSLGLDVPDPLRLCAQLRAIDRTRTIPILLVASEGQEPAILRAVEIGVNDYVLRPLDGHELLARARTQVRRHRMNETLRSSVHQTMRMAVKDQLTGLSNRRHFDRHGAALFEKARETGADLALVMLDIDHFKVINDTHGHAIGDEVLIEFANRLGRNVRSKDMACRLGGEEFVVAMPGTDLELAFVVADRMRREVAMHPFVARGGAEQLSVTTSAGVAIVGDGDASLADTLARADAALYNAKQNGRDQVRSIAA